jgi:hypothetical protein
MWRPEQGTKLLTKVFEKQYQLRPLPYRQDLGDVFILLLTEPLEFLPLLTNVCQQSAQLLLVRRLGGIAQLLPDRLEIL